MLCLKPFYTNLSPFKNYLLFIVITFVYLQNAKNINIRNYEEIVI